MNNTFLIIAGVVAAILLLLLIIILVSLSQSHKNIGRLNSRIESSNELTQARIQAANELTNDRMDAYFNSYAELMSQNQKAISQQQDLRLRALEESVLRMRQENNQQLDSMRETVDEKLQTTLDEKITQSFGLVNERLEQVYKGLGEMQAVASNVTDLKKILSNVKTRGILGEVQLAAILKQILTSDQFDENVATIRGSSNRVEFAVRLPGDGDEIVYLPIDSKFPGDTYSLLMDAYQTGNRELIEKCQNALAITLRKEAKDISEKYIAPPYTTDFGIMFLPFEGLYAEAVNMGMVEVLQRDYKVTIAGPTTMAALLNSLQMGFNTLAIEKKSSEVWKTLAEVKAEFAKFDAELKNARNRLRQADEALDRLEGTRTRAINRKLRDVMLLDGDADGEE